MAEQSIDVLMKVVNKGSAMQAESRTQFISGNVPDQLRQGFEPGRFCELQEFSFSAGAGASLTKQNAKAKKKAEEKAKKEKDEEAKRGDRPLSQAEKRGLILDSQESKHEKHEASEVVDMQPVEFTRVFDTASTLMFRALVECDTLDSISVVKRKAAHTANSGECYLRVDFTKCLLTNLEWKDSEHIVIESGTFIYREVRIRYRPQKEDGTLSTVIESTWKMKSAAK